MGARACIAKAAATVVAPLAPSSRCWSSSRVALRKAWPAIVSAVEIAAWTVAGVTGAAIVITGGVLTARAVRRRRALIYRPGQPFMAVVDEAQSLFPRPLPPAGRPASGQIEPPSDARPGRWPVTGWLADGEELRPRIGGDGNKRRR